MKEEAPDDNDDHYYFGVGNGVDKNPILDRDKPEEEPVNNSQGSYQLRKLRQRNKKPKSIHEKTQPVSWLDQELLKLIQFRGGQT